MEGVDKDLLKEIGLTNNEVEVYLKLLMGGSVTVNTIAERTGMHRQACYDALDRLLEKGFVSFVIKDGKKNFQALPQEQVLNYIDNLKSQLNEMLPALKKISVSSSESTQVEVYKGKNALRTVLRDVIQTLKEKPEIVSINGIDETKFLECDKQAIDKYILDMRKFGFKERLLAMEGATDFIPGTQSEYRFLPKEFFNPNPTFIYGEKVVFIVWGTPLYSVMIKSKEVADANRKQFNILWRIAKPK